MTKKYYNKLVRDKIPDIIEDSGKRAAVHQVSRGTLREYAFKKLREEVEEFIEDPCSEEAADIIEILEFICQREGLTPLAIEAERIAKRVSKGGFEMGFLLEWATDE